MKQNIFFVLKERWLFLFFMFESSILGAVIAALKKSEETLTNAFFLKKMYLKEAITYGISFGTIMVILIFVLLVFYEFKKKNK